MNMNKSLLNLLASVGVAALTAFGVVKACTPKLVSEGETAALAADGSAYRTVNLSATEYPDFTYAAESAVDAVVYVKVTIHQQASAIQIRSSSSSSVTRWLRSPETSRRAVQA